MDHFESTAATLLLFGLRPLLLSQSNFSTTLFLWIQRLSVILTTLIIPRPLIEATSTLRSILGAPTHLLELLILYVHGLLGELCECLVDIGGVLGRDLEEQHVVVGFAVLLSSICLDDTLRLEVLFITQNEERDLLRLFSVALAQKMVAPSNNSVVALRVSDVVHNAAAVGTSVEGR